MIRFLSLIAIIMTFAASASAQEAAADSRASTGGAQTLADILERQEGLKVDETFRSEATGNPDAAAPITGDRECGILAGLGVLQPTMKRCRIDNRITVE